MPQIPTTDDPRFTDQRTPPDGSVTAAKLATNLLDTDGTLAANSDTRTPSQKAARTYIAAQIAALVNSAPGALDTLGELATALAADESAAAALTTLVGTKAPLASPAFTGHPTGVTESAGDNSTRLASTAYVDAAAALKVTAANVPTAVKTADQTLTSSSTTLQDVSSLGLTIGASSTEMWRVTYWLIVNAANATMDLKFGFTVPTSCTMLWGPIGANVNGWQVGGTAASILALATQAQTQIIGSGAVSFGVPFTAIVFGGGTGGTVQLQAAQNTSDAGALKILKGSMMEAVKVAS